MPGPLLLLAGSRGSIEGQAGEGGTRDSELSAAWLQQKVKVRAQRRVAYHGRKVKAAKAKDAEKAEDAGLRRLRGMWHKSGYLADAAVSTARSRGHLKT